MTFPVWIALGPWRLHPHVFFEVLAYILAAVTFLALRRRHGDPLTGIDRLTVVAAVFVGALVGSRALAWLDNPEARARGLVALMEGKTLVGGLLGAWIATEAEKRRGGVHVGKSFHRGDDAESAVCCRGFPTAPMGRRRGCRGASTSATASPVIRRRSTSQRS